MNYSYAFQIEPTASIVIKHSIYDELFQVLFELLHAHGNAYAVDVHDVLFGEFLFDVFEVLVGVDVGHDLGEGVFDQRVLSGGPSGHHQRRQSVRVNLLEHRVEKVRSRSQKQLVGVVSLLRGGVSEGDVA